jgi:hypothetical protein
VIACAALLVSMSGTGYAAFKLPAKSVGTTHLKKGAVTSPKIKPNAVRSAQVLDGSLLARDFQPDQLPAGPQGPVGAKGEMGDRGDKGDKGDAGATSVTMKSAVGTPAAPGVTSTATATCDSGHKAVGGGFTWGASGTGFLTLPVFSLPQLSGGIPAGWAARVQNIGSGGTVQAIVFVLCAAP